MNTEIIKINSPESDGEKIERAASVIKAGGLVVFPTETVYGIGADGTNEAAVAKIFEAKGRPSDNPLIIHLASATDAEKYTYTCELYYKLAEEFMPGPLTVILKSKDIIPSRTRGGLETVALRCPADPIASALIRAAGVPIAAPSANLSGSPSPTTFSHVADDMTGRVDVIIDGGDSDFGLESTIVKIENDDTLTLLRPGKITVDDLSKIAKNINVASAVTDKLADGEIALSPGMKYRHYAPKAPVVLLDGSADEIVEYISERQEKNVAIIAYSEHLQKISSAVPSAFCYDFGLEENSLDQAHRLFSILREADKRDFSVIYAPLPSTDGIGLALYNRMIRAAAHKIIRLRR